MQILLRIAAVISVVAGLGVAVTILQNHPLAEDLPSAFECSRQMGFEIGSYKDCQASIEAAITPDLLPALMNAVAGAMGGLVFWALAELLAAQERILRKIDG